MRDRPGSGLTKTLITTYPLRCLHLIVLRKRAEPRLGGSEQRRERERGKSNELSVVYDVMTELCDEGVESACCAGQSGCGGRVAHGGRRVQEAEERAELCSLQSRATMTCHAPARLLMTPLFLLPALFLPASAAPPHLNIRNLGQSSSSNPLPPKIWVSIFVSIYTRSHATYGILYRLQFS